MGAGKEICVVGISTAGKIGAVTKTVTMHESTQTMIRSLSRQARKKANVQSYEIEKAFVAIEYGPKGAPRSASISWLSFDDVVEQEMLILLNDVWRAAKLAAAA